MNMLKTDKPMNVAMPVWRRTAAIRAYGRKRGTQTKKGKPISTSRVKITPPDIAISHNKRCSARKVRTHRYGPNTRGENSGLAIVYQIALPLHHSLPLSLDMPEAM